MGTPDFAVASLEALVKSGKNIVGVVTSPDRPAGRGQKLKSSPVKIFAVENQIPVLQPVKFKDPLFLKSLKELEPDLFIVVAFRMLPEIVWGMPPLGTFNLHASLLPHYRGAAPINWALINGESETGLTTFLIDDKIDTGKIILQEKVAVSKEITAGELHDILMNKGAELVLKTVDILSSGNTVLSNQAEFMAIDSELMAAPKLNKENCKIDWSLDCLKVYNFIRGLSPYPGAWTEFINEDEEILSLKILRAELSPQNDFVKCGHIKITEEKELIVYCGSGAIKLTYFQPSGKNPMTSVDFLRGYRKKLTRAICD